MYLRTQRLIVRDFVPEDVFDLHAILGDPQTMRHAEPPYSFEQTQAFLSSFCIRQNAAVAAALRDAGKVIGYILFHETGDGVYEMGWFFHRAYWRQGFAYEACKAVIDDAFCSRSAHKVFAETTDAAASAALMRKLGMKPEGVQRSQVKEPAGNWADLYLYGILKEDWRSGAPDGVSQPK